MSQIIVAPGARRGRGRPRRDAESVDALRSDVVAAAEVLFAAGGVAATSVDDVAREAGTSRATVYRVVGGKDEIVLAVTLRRYDEWVDGLLSHLGRFETAEEILVEAVLWTMRSVRREPSLGALFQGGTALAASAALTDDGAALERITRFSRELATLLAARIDELRPGLHPEIVGDRVLGVLLERLRRNAAPDLDSERAWLVTWLLPAVLADPPPLPASASRAPRRQGAGQEPAPHPRPAIPPIPPTPAPARRA